MKLIYVGDPMCSWCYGFAPELKKVVDETKDDLSLEIVMGGLRPYHDAKMNEMKDFLTKHWKEVNHASGQPFKYDILNRADLSYDTEPPARAVVCVREMDPSKEYPFFEETQKLFYFENRDMNVAETYQSLIESLSLDYKTFQSLFNSEGMKMKIREDFERAGALGVRGFPTLLLQVDEVQKPIVLSRGYVQASQILDRIQQSQGGN